MIENQCAESGVLSITYDRFEFHHIKEVSGVSLYHHLQNVIRFSIMGLLVTLNDNPSLKKNLTKYDQQVLVRLSSEYLDSINEYSLQKTLDSLKSLKDKVQKFWNEWLPVVGPGIKAILKKLIDVEIDQPEKYQLQTTTQSSQLKYQLGLVVSLAKKLGFKSIYILIDRVDESELTGNDAIASFKIVEPLLRDLELLEFEGVAFKFFLWDQLEPAYSAIARTDRIKQETLEWTDYMLESLLHKRLLAYSRNKLSSLNDISEVTAPYSADELVLIFANHSPRDMIRIGGQVVSEQQEIDPFSGNISAQAIYTGIDKFCIRRASELASNKTLHDLQRIQQVDFTIPYLAGEIFKEEQNPTRNRIYRWRKEGTIVDVDRIDNENPTQTRQVKLMALTDIRIAKVVCSELDLPSFLQAKYKHCPRCGTTVLRDWGDKNTVSRCHNCQFDVVSEEEDTWESWKRKQLAVQSRRTYREESLEFAQATLFDEDIKQ